jgi:hypothetical protein
MLAVFVAINISTALAQSAEKVWRLGVLTPRPDWCAVRDVSTVMLPEL